jgi:hypothetical protein
MSQMPTLPAALAHDWRGLQDLIDATAQRQRVPCRQGRDKSRSWWTSDNATEQAAAAEACAGCPVLTQCRAYGIDHPKESGVYGAMTEKQRAQAARARSKS